MEGTIVQTIVQAISSLGFPIVVAMYSLIRLEKTVKENTLSLKENIVLMTKIYERLDRERDI